MSADSTTKLQAVIERIKGGDGQSYRELLERAHQRLRKLTGSILSRSFPILKRGHELDSVVDEVWVRLAQALEKTHPPTVADFFRLAAFKIRQVLLDMIERERRRMAREVVGLDEGPSSAGPRLEPADRTLDPARLALWTELHQKVSRLPEPERQVFEMHYYLNLPQAEIATLLELHPRKVSHLWVAATERLAQELGGAEHLL